MGTPKNSYIKVGDTFGCLTIIGYAGQKEFESELRNCWLVECKCGKGHIMVNRNIRRNKNKRCGKDCDLK